MTRNEFYEDLKMLGAFLTLLAGIVLMFCSLYIPPEGIIHESVLIALGELLTFVGSVWGISHYSKIQIKKIQSINNKNEQ